MLTPRQWAVKHSAACFLNSYLRDTAAAYDSNTRAFHVPLDGGTLSVPVVRLSRVGVHDYGDVFVLSGPEGERRLDFPQAAELLCAGAPHLQRRLENSLHNMELSLAESSASIHRLYGEGPAFLAAEQGLHVGHNFHPHPKSRDEFSDEDLRRFAPEFTPTIHLHWYFVRPEVVWEEHSRAFGATDWGSELYAGRIPAGFIAYPAHPWQKAVWEKDPQVQRLLRQGLVREAGPSSEVWHPTSSLRTLFSPGRPYMVKFSLSVRLTNSLRHLQPGEASRGMQLHDALHTPAGREFSRRFPDFRVLHEPVCFALKGEDGAPMPQTMVLLRENPLAPDSRVVALATLNQQNPLGEDNLIAASLWGGSARAWFHGFMEQALVPLLVAQADYGIMLGAHQQNLLLELGSDGIPKGAYFRDCQGTGFSALGEALLGPHMPDPKKFLAHVVPGEAATALFGYYLVVNSVFNTVAAAARAGGLDEAVLLNDLRGRLRRLCREVKDPFIIHHLLDSPWIAQKGNFRCGQQGLNENTAENPLAIYNPIPNPLSPETPMHPTPAETAFATDPTLREFQGVTREEFFQTPGLWNFPSHDAHAPERWNRAAPLPHPIRADRKDGPFYRRHVPSIGKTVSFRGIDPEKDLSTFHRWHNQPRVAFFWELAQSEAELKAYLEKTKADPHMIPTFVEFDGRPVGYFEMYWTLEDRLGPYYPADAYDRGFHFLIGEKDALGFSNTDAIVKSALHFLFLDDPRTRRVMAEPRHDNTKVLRYAESSGWTKLKEFDFPHKRAALMECRRENFFNGERL